MICCASPRPDIVAGLHDAYFEAGADFAETNTFNAHGASASRTTDLRTHAADINLAAAALAREAADRWTEKTPDKPRFVGGAIGPLNRTLSMSSDVNDPGARQVPVDEEFTAAYLEQARALHEGGVDFFLVETIFDTLNAKAAIKAILDLQDEGFEPLPLWISGTITDRSGRTLSGQTVEAFWHSIRHARPFAVGFNCALGADLMRPHIAELSRIADAPWWRPIPMPACPMRSANMTRNRPRPRNIWANGPEERPGEHSGGCCGTTPDHIRAIARAVAGETPRPAPKRHPAMRLSGLEAFELA